MKKITVMPERVYRYRNLSVVVWKDNDAGKPTITIGRGFKPQDSTQFVNLRLSLYKDNIPALIKLLETYLQEYPSASAGDIVIERKVFS